MFTSMFTVAAFYRFTTFVDPAALKAPLEAACRAGGVRGTVILAPEGINGTIAGPRGSVAAALAHIRALPGCEDLDCKESVAAAQPFLRLKIRIKREIVTMRQPQANPSARVGTHVAPEDWNALISAEDVAVIDARNDYEVRIGRFEGAIDPGTASFAAFPAWWAENRNRFAGKRVAMYCTGGIRCEKASSYLLSEGVEAVFQLKGGVLKYLEGTPAAESLWRGECFVFDGRVAVGRGLAQGSHDLCHACRRPVSAEERADPTYLEGVRCPACADERTGEDRARFAERQRQIGLARRRCEAHLGRKG